MGIKRKLSTDFLVTLFAICSVALGLVSTVIYKEFLYYPVLVVTLFVGCIALLKVGIIDRKVFKAKDTWLLIAFCVSYAGTILLNRHSGLFTNCGQLAYTACYFFVIYYGFSVMSKSRHRKVLKILCQIVFWFALLASAISFTMLLLQYSGTVVYQDTEVIVGVVDRGGGSQLFGIGSGPSSVGDLSLAGILSAWYLFWKPSGKFTWKWFFPTVLFILTLCAANAYSVLLMLLAFAVSTAFCRHFGNTSSGTVGKRTLKIITQATLFCVAVVVIFYGVQRAEAALVNVGSDMKYRIELETDELETDEGKPTGTEVMDEPEKITISRSITTSATGARLSIWREGIKLFLENPLGVTNDNICVKVFYGVPDYPYYNLHNGYLTLLVSSGIIGFALIMVFGVILLVRACKYLFSCQNDVERKRIGLLISLCVAILAGDLVNGCFVLWRNLQYPILWIMLGIIEQTINDTEEETSLPEKSNAERM